MYIQMNSNVTVSLLVTVINNYILFRCTGLLQGEERRHVLRKRESVMSRHRPFIY